MGDFRRIKDNLIRNKNFLKFFLFVINLPIVGNVYDYFYLKKAKNKIENSEFELTIEPNNVCNLRCVMCPYKRMQRKKEQMSMSVFKKIIDQGHELGLKVVSLQQYNEPFLDKKIFERIRYVRKKNKNIKIHLYSNGMVLSDDLIKKVLMDPPDRIRFSFDAAKKKTFESIRVGAKFEKVRDNILKLYQERNEKNQELPIIEVYFTLLEKNKKEANGFLKMWKNKVDYASLYPADSRESGSFSIVDYKHKKPYPCFNPNNLVILSNGKMALCCVDFEGEVILGDLKKQSLKEIINSKKFNAIKKSHLERKNLPDFCKKCSKLYVDSALIWWAI